MSINTMTCTCGNVIRDAGHETGVSVPFRASLLPGQAVETFVGAIERAICGYVEAIRSGRRDEWLRAAYGPDAEVADELVVSDIIIDATAQFRVIYQCERSGRLWVEADLLSNSLLTKGSRMMEYGFEWPWRGQPFAPEGEWRGILETKPEWPE